MLRFPSLLPVVVLFQGRKAHSVRGFLSTAGKKRGLDIDSAKNDAGERVYQIEK